MERRLTAAAESPGVSEGIRFHVGRFDGFIMVRGQQKGRLTPATEMMLETFGMR
jgi:hypothetical protein